MLIRTETDAIKLIFGAGYVRKNKLARRGMCFLFLSKLFKHAALLRVISD